MRACNVHSVCMCTLAVCVVCKGVQFYNYLKFQLSTFDMKFIVELRRIEIVIQFQIQIYILRYQTLNFELNSQIPILQAQFHDT